MIKLKDNKSKHCGAEQSAPRFIDKWRNRYAVERNKLKTWLKNLAIL